MNSFYSPLYDEPRRWIQIKYERDMPWDEICMAGKKTDEELSSFLSSRVIEDDWPQMTINDWNKLVREMQASSKDQLEIKMEGNDGALYDMHNDSGFSIPQHPKSSWQLYKSHLDWNEDSIKELQAATNGILRRLKKDTRETGPIKGLVVGNVQSGKTANMEALMAMAADYGWNVFIVLSGTIENLRMQTLRRMQKDLNHDGNLFWIGFEHPKKNARTGERLQDFNLNNDSSRRYFTVCLKNPTRLKNLIEWIQSDKSSHEQMRILIIDDEADQASVRNTKANKDRKGINKLIVDLVNDTHHKGEKHAKGKAIAIDYVMYTATPYANFLNESTPESLYPSDFIWTLKPSSEYIGPNQIFGLNDAGSPDGLDIKRVIPNRDLDQIVKIYKHQSTTIPDTMIDSICWFICAVAVLRFRGDYNKKPISMLVHTSQQQKHHAAVAESIKKWIDSMSNNDSLIERCEKVYKYETERMSKEKWLSQMPDYGISEKKIRDYPDFNEIVPEIKKLTEDKMQFIKMDDEGDLQYHKGIHLVIDNCANNGISSDNEHIRLAYPDPDSEDYPSPAPAFIIVGGSTLSRGLTIEGLVSTFFLRASCQADTLMQMGRWFGYRRGYELLPRIWMTTDTIDKFKFLSELERDLRSDLKKYMFDDITPRDYGPSILCSPKVSWLKLTSKNHMQSAVPAEMDFSGAKPQTVLFDNDASVQKRNVKITEDFLDGLGKPTGISADNTSVFWNDIDIKDIEEKLLLNKLSFSDRSRVFNEMGAFCEWIHQLSGQQPLQKWTVIAAGKDDIKAVGSQESKQWVVSGYRIGKVNRSQRISDDKSVIDIGALRALKDLVADIDADIIRKVMGEKSITKQEHIDKIRLAAKRNMVPLILIYRIDKNSKPGKDSLDRCELDIDSDIIGIQICVPGAPYNKDFRKRMTVFLPEKDKEDEVEETE